MSVKNYLNNINFSDYLQEITIDQTNKLFNDYFTNQNDNVNPILFFNSLGFNLVIISQNITKIIDFNTLLKYHFNSKTVDSALLNQKIKFKYKQIEMPDNGYSILQYSEYPILEIDPYRHDDFIIYNGRQLKNNQEYGYFLEQYKIKENEKIKRKYQNLDLGLNIANTALNTTLSFGVSKNPLAILGGLTSTALNIAKTIDYMGWEKKVFAINQNIERHKFLLNESDTYLINNSNYLTNYYNINGINLYLTYYPINYLTQLNYQFNKYGILINQRENLNYFFVNNSEVKHYNVFYIEGDLLWWNLTHVYNGSFIMLDKFKTMLNNGIFFSQNTTFEQFNQQENFYQGDISHFINNF